MVKDVILGEKAFEAISAVEGLSLTASHRDRIEKLRREGHSDEQIRQVIIAEFDTRAAA